MSKGLIRKMTGAVGAAKGAAAASTREAVESAGSRQANPESAVAFAGVASVPASGGELRGIPGRPQERN